MKVKDARKLLEGYSGKELYQQGCKLFRQEVNHIIILRSHGKEPSRGTIEGAISQVKDWFLKVAEGFPWDNIETSKNIVSWESGRIWSEYGIINPEIERYRNRVKIALLKGESIPFLKALTPEAVDAMGSMILANLRTSAQLYTKRNEFAKGLGKRVCPYGEKERLCKYQVTYSMAGVLPLSIEDCVFTCIIDECVKE